MIIYRSKEYEAKERAMKHKVKCYCFKSALYPVLRAKQDDGHGIFNAISYSIHIQNIRSILFNPCLPE